MRLENKAGLVTGASRGIGRAIALEFGRAGAKVAIVYNRAKEQAEALAREIVEAGSEALCLQHDVAQSEGVEALVGQVTEKFGRLDFSVHSAGIIRDDLVVRMSDEAWREVVDTNLNGTFYFCRQAALVMMRQRAGSIINISSVAAQHSNKGQANYAASKAGIEALTRTLASELSARGVRVNAIAPGFVETDMTTAVRTMAGDKIKTAIPLRRYGTPEDIARAALFLASEESSYITGQVLTVDGGLSLGGQV